MLHNSVRLCALFGAGAVAFSCVALADNDNHDSGPVRLLTTVPISGAKMNSFDISWVDADTQLYYLADRSNASVQVVDARRDKFVRAITPTGKLAFAGFHGSNDTAGPNGVAVSGHWLFVGDAPSRVVSIDLRTDQIVGDVSTGTTEFRADELAFDEEDSVLLVVNNADSPPFATLIKVDRNSGALTVQKRITFDKASTGVDATNGAEQPVWNPRTGRFYISIPQVGPNEKDGAVAKINPHSGAVEALFPVQFCQPAGLTLGPNQDLLLGCSVVFDTTGAVWDKSKSTNSAAPISVIMDARNGAIDRNVPGVSGSDEVWFNPGDGRYYLAARANAVGPTLGVIDARKQVLVEITPTVAPVSGSAHSVAANPHNNQVFVPLPANNVYGGCLNGCIAVFGQ